LSLVLIGLYGQINAQCDFDNCPEEVFIDVFSDACDETAAEIENQTLYPYDDAGTGAVISQADFLAMPNNPMVNGDCDDTELYGYVDGPIDISTDCAGDGYYSSFERTWEIYDAGGTVISTCTQFIRLVDNFDPFENIDLVAFFEDQDPDGLGWVITSNDCPAVVDWIEPTPGDFEDNCSPGNGINITATEVPGTAFDQGITTITYNFTDECGNRLVVDWDVEVECITCMGAPVFEDCNSPPIECDLNVINGFMSCTPDYNGVPGGSMCNGQGTIHNASYFSFIAGAEDIAITIGVADCVSNGGFIGVQANITDPCDENTCYGDSGAACFDSQFGFNATGLTIGNTYQLLVDGCNGSECAYTVSIDSAPPFEIPDPDTQEAFVETPSSCDIDPNDIEVCPGTTVTFNPENFTDAAFFFCWTLDDPSGATAVNASDDCETALPGASFSCSSTFSSCGPLELTFTTEGSYQLCLTEMDNGCDNHSEDDYGAYCYDIEVVAAVDLDFGIHEICESDLPFFIPPPHPVTGEQWQGPTGNNLVLGPNTFMVEDNCDCNYSQFVEINVLNQEPTIITQVQWCEYDLENWVDPDFGVDWDFIQADVSPTNPYIFEEVLIEGASDLVDSNGESCDVIVTYEFIVYDIPGEIVQTSGSACDATLCFEVDAANFPGFMSEGDIGHSWANPSGDVIGLTSCVSVSMAGTYTLTMTYVTDDGMTCTYMSSVVADLSGSTPGMPVFITEPLTACASQTTGLVYAVTPSAASDFTWTATNGTITAGAGTDQITVDVIDPGQPMTVFVFAETPGCGMSPLAESTLTVTPDPVVTLAAVPDVCVGTPADIMAIVTTGVATNYNWTVADPTAVYPGVNNNLSTLPVTWNTPGVQSYTVSVVDASGCVSDEITGMVNVLAELEQPMGMCIVENSTSVTIEWIDAPGQTTLVNPSMMGTTSGNTYTVDGLTAGQMVTFELVSDGATHPCGNSAPLIITCAASTCTVNPMIAPPAENDICQDGSVDPFQLVGTPPGGTWTGNGVDAAGVFDPANALPGQNVISYTVFDAAQNCDGVGNTIINVFNNPNPQFNLSATDVCIGELVTVTFGATTDDVAAWSFGDGAGAQVNVMDNIFDIGYATGGTKAIQLTLTNGSCQTVSEEFLNVYPALASPIVSCSPTPNSVEFSWDDLPGASEYILEVTSGGTTNTSTQGATTALIDNLTAGDEVMINVIAVDENGCENSMTLSSCTAQNCPVYNVVIDPGAQGPSVCYDVQNPPIFNLSAVVTDDTGAAVTGNFMWAGSDDIDETTGVFAPEGPGSYTLSYQYSDATNCTGIGTIVIDVLNVVGSGFIADEQEVCLGTSLTFDLTDAYNMNFDYDWTSSTDPANYDLLDLGDGTFTVVFTSDPGPSVDFSLVVDAGDCQSPSSEYTVDVLVPLDFDIVDFQECYGVDDPTIELGPFDANGDLVDGTWSLEDGTLLFGDSFDPAAVDSMYTLVFTEANCEESEMIDVEIVAKPNLEIGPLTQTICITDVAMVTIESNLYDEIQHMGDQPPLSGLEPNFELSFPSAGTYEYTSIIERPGGCDSDEITWEIIVEDVPMQPTISCTAQTLNSVSFGWTDVPCAGSYDIIINGGPGGEVVVTDWADSEYTVDGLNQGDEIEISVAITSDCECDFEDALIQMCSAMDCEPAPIVVGNELASDYCVSDLPPPFMLTATVSGVDIDNSGTFIFEGTGISDDGMVDINALSPGIYEIVVMYEEDGCAYTADPVSYEILGAPVPILDIQQAPCPESTEGVVNISAQGVGPFTIEGDQSLVEGDNNFAIGNHTISITDGNGCVTFETFTVGQAAAPVADLDVPDFAFTEMVQSFSFDLDGATVDNVIWTIDGVEQSAACLDANCSTIEFTPTEIKFYEICVEVTYGDCVYTECRQMEADELQIKSLYIPNVFDPSNELNPLNSVLQMYVEGCDLTIKDFSVYDRWGGRVFYDDTDKVGADEDVITLWDGRFADGRQHVPGVYIYVMEIEYEDYTEFMTGDVTIID